MRIIKHTPGIRAAFAELRRGYPDLPPGEQSRGRPFREAAGVVIRAVVSETSRLLRHSDLQKALAVLPWRAGLAFGKAWGDAGVGRFYHVSSMRDEETLKTVVDHEEGPGPAGAVIIADPMLATGNTTADAIRRLMEKGAKAADIVVNAVVAAPEGVEKIRSMSPEIEVVVGALDEKLDRRGYIVPGLGDFGDKYFAEMSEAEARNLAGQFSLSEQGRCRLDERLCKKGA